MPAGVYTVMDGEGSPVGTEEFRCAPGPAGWRYFSSIETSVPEPHHESVDLVVDSDWLPLRLRVDTGSHRLEVAAHPERLAGALDGEPLEVPWDGALDLDYLSPAFNAVTARRLGRTAEIRVVYFEPVTCVPTFERQRYELLGNGEVATPVGRFAASRWRYTSRSTGWSREFWVAGDIVVTYGGLFELTAFDPGPRGPFPVS